LDGSIYGINGHGRKHSQGLSGFDPLFKKREDLKPTAFISANTMIVLLNFMHAELAECGVLKMKQSTKKNGSSLSILSDDRYYVEITAVPRLENWSILKQPVVVAVIPLGIKPVIHSG
jgi:hypothetical protein